MSRLVGTCLECGGARKTSRASEFCCSPCRRTWGKRRMLRGSELYDIYMAHRFERETAADLGVMQAINRLASIFRMEDHAERASRQSWRKPRDVMMDRPGLKTMHSTMKIGRGI